MGNGYLEYSCDALLRESRAINEVINLETMTENGRERTEGRCFHHGGQSTTTVGNNRMMISFQIENDIS